MEEQRLYETLAHRIETMIEGGTLREGTKAPSVRQLSAQQGVSVSTVLHAYRLLEDKGWIEARPQSGYYVRRSQRKAPGGSPNGAARVPEPETSSPPIKATPVEVGELIRRIFQATQQPGLVQMGAAVGFPETFPNRQLQSAFRAALRENPEVAHAYDLAPGCFALREQIAKRALHAGCALTPDDIILTVGCSEALGLCLRAVANCGDTIALESPVYLGVLQIIESLGLHALELPTHPRTGVSLEALEYALEHEKIAACVLSPTAQNPLGASMPNEAKQRLVRMLSQREVPLIEDDIWGDTSFESPRPRAAKSFDQDGWVLLCSSFSKTVAPGLRAGWVAPGRFRAKVEFLKLMANLGNATLPSLALAKFLENGGYDHHLRALRRMHAQGISLITALIEEHFPSGTCVTRPVGGQVVWVELPGQIDTLELWEMALREGICIAPGAMFSAKGKYANCLRVYGGHHDPATAERALRTVGRLTHQLAR